MLRTSSESTTSEPCRRADVPDAEPPRVADLAHEIQIVLHQHDAEPSRRELDQDAPDQQPLGPRQSGGRLIQQQHAGLQRQHHRQLERLLHAVRQVAASTRSADEPSRLDHLQRCVGQVERTRRAANAATASACARCVVLPPRSRFRIRWRFETCGRPRTRRTSTAANGRCRVR